AGSPIVLGPPEQSIFVLLHGLAASGNDRTYPTQMVPMATNSNGWIANVLSYLRNSFGNEAPFVTAAEVDRVRKTTQDRTVPPTLEEVRRFLLPDGDR